MEALDLTAIPLRRCGPASGDRARELFDTQFDFVWRFVRRLGVPPSAVDDAAQEVFLVAARHIESIRQGCERAYLVGVAIRVCSQFRRSERRRRTEAVEPQKLDLPDELAVGVEELAALQRARRVLDTVLDAMPVEVREVFVLYELEQMTLPEISEAVGAPLGTVKSRIRRGRELFEALAERHRRQELGDGGHP